MKSLDLGPLIQAFSKGDDKHKLDVFSSILCIQVESLNNSQNMALQLRKEFDNSLHHELKRNVYGTQLIACLYEVRTISDFIKSLLKIHDLYDENENVLDKIIESADNDTRILVKFLGYTPNPFVSRNNE